MTIEPLEFYTQKEIDSILQAHQEAEKGEIIKDNNIDWDSIGE